ncbi:hypothetical protein ZIOFF_069960 [Zingiber officinale]|uniref:FAR1 domain-containing protein n=1 Tax=Zingiber officinale TaxID=94328 RepID=A0A8J5CWC3_ZINOF|nr:hypothetical protein ZIOFF_069960 [Zingiber officinale]
MDQGKSDSNEVNDNNDHVSTDLSPSSLNEVMIPKIGMTFISEDEVRNFYKSYAQNVGFGISKLGGKMGDDGKQKYFCFGCAKSGKTVSQAKNALYPKPSIKTNCKAKINVVIRNDDNFVISSVSLEHNHVLSPGKSRHFRFEAGGYENLTFDERKCRNYISEARRLRLIFCDATQNTRFLRVQAFGVLYMPFCSRTDDKSVSVFSKKCHETRSHSTGCLEKEVFIKRIYMEVPTAKSKRRINLKGQTNRAVEIESGKSRRVQNNSASNTATGQLTNTNNEPEKAKRNLKKANSSPVRKQRN